MTVHTEGDRVRGKSKRLSGKRGAVVSVRKEGKHHTYEVRWDSGRVECVHARGITADIQLNHMHDEENHSSDQFKVSTLHPTPFAQLHSDMSISSDSSRSDDEVINLQQERHLGVNGDIIVNNRKWMKCDSITADAGSLHTRRKARLVWPRSLGLGSKTFARYFYLMYPMDSLRKTLEATNKRLAQRREHEIDEGDFFRWIGLRLAMMIEPRRGPLRVYWEHEAYPNCIRTPASFGERFGMSRHTFENILNCLCFADEERVIDDPWHPIRPLINAFNDHRRKVVYPGDLLCIDECTSSWQELEAKYSHEGIPHLTKIPRKPEGIGAEMKCIADVDTGIMLGLDIMEGKERQMQKAYRQQYGEGTAVVLRLSQYYAGSGRTIIADSAFASVKTLVELDAFFGLHFMGMVKTATSEYPMKYLLDWFNSSPPRGSYSVLQSDYSNGKKMYALCWADKTAKTIISSRGTTLPGSESIRIRHRKLEIDGEFVMERYEKRIPRPQMVELFFSGLPTVDIHDHYRQGSLEMEREWTTRSWIHRMFTTLLGTIITDSYLAYKYEASDGDIFTSRSLDFGEFLDHLAHELIFNEYNKARSKSGGVVCDSDDDTWAIPKHSLSSLSDLDEYRKIKNTKRRAQRLCRICKRKSSFYCRDCSNAGRKEYFSICGPSTGRSCYVQHINLTLG